MQQESDNLLLHKNPHLKYIILSEIQWKGRA